MYKLQQGRVVVIHGKSQRRGKLRMTRTELVFIPLAAAGHIMSTVELAKLLVDRDESLSITVLAMKLPFFKAGNYTTVSSSRIKFIDLPDDAPASDDPPVDRKKFWSWKIEKTKTHVREAASQLISRGSQSSHDSPRLAGFVLDMFCAGMVDVANEFDVPSYIFFSSGAAFLGLLFHIQGIRDEQGVDPSEFANSDDELAMPTLVHPFPARVLPTSVLQKDSLENLLNFTRKFEETKGIIINTFSELEPHAVNVLTNGSTPPLYPVGPILNLKQNGHDGGNNNFDEIMQWLDDQPPSSVVFLCFGSMGSFPVEQVKEIASALENSGHRFLWSLRKPPPKDKMESPTDYSDPQEVLPDGFLDRTSDVGRVVGWVPQVDVLAHPSIGGFVSHCGWNSTLESIWFGVPIAAWPLYAEQQLNAFELVVELGLAVEIKMDYRSNLYNTLSKEVLVAAEDIERGIRCLMNPDDKRIKLVNEMRENSRKALAEGGSSYMSIGRLIRDITDNIP